MSEEEFVALSLDHKWAHLKKTMDYIVSMDRQYTNTRNMFSLRRRYNSHHKADQVEEETRLIKEQQRNLRLDQYQRWAHVKTLYSVSRDELINTLGNPEFEKCKGILERIFTMELDDALRDVIEET